MDYTTVQSICTEYFSLKRFWTLHKNLALTAWQREKNFFFRGLCMLKIALNSSAMVDFNGLTIYLGLLYA